MPGLAADGDLTAAHFGPLNEVTASFNDLRTGWDRYVPGLSP